jgi:hypothetical protein
MQGDLQASSKFGGVRRRPAYLIRNHALEMGKFSAKNSSRQTEPNDQSLKGYGQDENPSKRKQAAWRNALCKL